jgi:hypothetical protein
LLVTSFGTIPYGVSIDFANTYFNLHSTLKMYYASGQFSTTIKTSGPVPTGVTLAQDISWNGTDTLLVGETTNKMFKISGRFTTTVKTSQIITNDVAPRGIESDDFVTRIADPGPEVVVSETEINFNLFLDQARPFTSYINQAKGVDGFIDQARNFDLEL